MGKQKPYGYVENMMLFEAAFFDTRLQGATKLILALIIRHTQQDGTSSHFSINETAKKKGVSRQAIQNQVNKLIKFGYIEKHETKAGYRNKYTLLLDQIRNDTPATSKSCTLDPATQLDCIPATSKDCLPATSEGCTKKIEENKDIKKEKALTRDSFLGKVKEENREHSFQEVGNISEAIIDIQASKCWAYWEANNSFPKGNYISAFKVWLYNGLDRGKIKTTRAQPLNGIATKRILKQEPTNPSQEWHKRIEDIVGNDVFQSWFRECWHNNNGELCAPSAFKAQHIRQHYSEEIKQVLPYVKIVHRTYKAKEENIL